MLVCVHKLRKDHVCKGRLTWEHSTNYGRKALQARWAIVPCCLSKNVGVYGKDKNFNRYIAILRAFQLGVDLSAEYPKVNWGQLLARYENMFPEFGEGFRLGKLALFG